jgi:cbb3-type cytochrome oxidase subunit 3
MISPVLKFQILRLLAYIVITISYTKHYVSFWLLIILFLVIELNVWISFFVNKRGKNSNSENQKLLDDMRDNLLKKD